MRRLIISAVALLLFIAPRAQAQAWSTSFTVLPQESSGATGTFHVTLTTTDWSTFDVNVVGDYNGNLTDPDGSGPLQQKHAVGTLTFTFMDGQGATVAGQAVGSSGSSTTGAEGGGVSPAHSYIGGDYVVTVGTSAFSWKAQAPSEANYLSGFGANEFSGTIKLAGQAADVYVGLMDTNQWFSGEQSVVPEAPSLALLLPGLLPLGLVLRRRATT